MLEPLADGGLLVHLEDANRTPRLLSRDRKADAERRLSASTLLGHERASLSPRHELILIAELLPQDLSCTAAASAAAFSLFSMPIFLKWTCKARALTSNGSESSDSVDFRYRTIAR
jgi:hypothetical protein